VCFRWGEWLWVGDTLFAGSIGRTDLPGGSFEELERSIRTRLFPLGDPLHAFTGHGPATTLGRERRDNPFVGEHARFA
jgi:glyoxylase-like metal-dependent hydrolase (beta-lactamase superfamily II)